jgi:hypothetical protein
MLAAHEASLQRPLASGHVRHFSRGAIFNGDAWSVMKLSWLCAVFVSIDEEMGLAAAVDDDDDDDEDVHRIGHERLTLTAATDEVSKVPVDLDRPRQ